MNLPIHYHTCPLCLTEWPCANPDCADEKEAECLDCLKAGDYFAEEMASAQAEAGEQAA